MMKSSSTLSFLLVVGSMAIMLTADAHGQQLDLRSSSRRTAEQDEPSANEPAALDTEDDSSMSDAPSEDTEPTQYDQSVSSENEIAAAENDLAENDLAENDLDENELDKSDDNTLNGEFGFTNWPRRSIQEIQVALDQQARTPEDRSASLQSFGRNGGLPTSPKLFAWAAPNIRYQPLYFEDVALERYGQTLPRRQQAVKSGIHFFKSFALLPYQMLHDHPHECDAPLGFCRPGTCVPRTVQRQYFGSVFAK